MGRLHALIKTALENQVINHYKTLIIKAQERDLQGNSTLRLEIDSIKKKFVVLLKENRERGITLAQMHNMVQKRFGIKFDLTKLGYPKLKKFLEEIEGIYFDHGDNANHIKARYKSPQ